MLYRIVWGGGLADDMDLGIKYQAQRGDPT